MVLQEEGLQLRRILKMLSTKRGTVTQIEICSREDLRNLSIMRNEPLLEHRVRDTERRGMLQKELAKIPSSGLVRIR